MIYKFKNVLGTFNFNNKLEIVKGEGIEELPKEKISRVLANFKDKKYFAEFYNKNAAITKQKIKESVSEDSLLVNTSSNITELDKSINMLIKRLREWYALYLPEFEHTTYQQEVFVEAVINKTKSELIKELDLDVTMGADLDELHVKEMQLLAERIRSLQALRKEHETYLETVMVKYCPNLLELAGATIGAKLLEQGKSLKKLALLPASTIQLLGAEKALFRHIKSGSRSPKYGVIFAHQLIQNAKRTDRGRAARFLADKLSLCCRLDYFKGEFKAPEYKKALEERLGCKK
jgi:nucleolar protein 56